MQDIPHTDLICMNDLAKDNGFEIDLVYAQADHPENMFGEAIYRTDAKFWLYKTLAEITQRAAQLAQEKHGWTLILKDGLRPVEAQAAIAETSICRANPQWFQEPRMFSPPGKGGHPRGMAVDVDAKDKSGKLVDFGTAFDTMAENPAPQFNLSHRENTDHPQQVLDNRAKLTALFVTSAQELGLPMAPLSVEWWDYRFPIEYYNQYAPIHDKDLPENMRMLESL